MHMEQVLREGVEKKDYTMSVKQEKYSWNKNLIRYYDNTMLKVQYLSKIFSLICTLLCKFTHIYKESVRTNIFITCLHTIQDKRKVTVNLVSDF